MCTKFWCLLISWSREPCDERWHSFSFLFSSDIDSRLYTSFAIGRLVLPRELWQMWNESFYLTEVDSSWLSSNLCEVKTHTPNVTSLLGNAWDLILAKHFLIDNDGSVVLVPRKWEEKTRQSDSTNYTRISGTASTQCWRNWRAGAVSSVPTASVADTLPLSHCLEDLSASVQTRVNRIEWLLYLLKLSFFSPLVRHVSRCLLIKCCGTLTEHTGHSTAKDT